MLTIAIFFLAFFHQATAARIGSNTNLPKPSLQTLTAIPSLLVGHGSADCLKAAEDLETFKQQYLANAKIVSDYVLSMGHVTEQWASVLSPFETQTVQLAVGTYLPMVQAAVATDESVQKIGNWMAQVDSDLKSFGESIDTCKMTKADHDKWANAFQLFSEKNEENLGVSVEYISSLGAQFTEWNSKWSQMETAPVFLPAGEFDVVREASQGLFESADLIWSNAQMAIDELGGITLKELRNGRGANDGTLQLHRR